MKLPIWQELKYIQTKGRVFMLIISKEVVKEFNKKNNFQTKYIIVKKIKSVPKVVLHGILQMRIFISLFVITVILITGCTQSSLGPIMLKGTQIEYLFPKEGQRPDTKLVSLINSAKKSLDIAIYSITKKNISGAIIAAEKRGVRVRLITDRETSRDKYEKGALALLTGAGVPLKVNAHSGLMHLKVTIVDDSIVTTGSYNYTDSATFKNDEVLVIIHDLASVSVFKKEFLRMWEDTRNFNDY
jgi:phosphatidylserine/phosphatidylglycerophosphate/cardiolipin synthase-like enzyme